MMWQKIKNWIIKKLGGYTKAEYENLSKRPVERFEFIPHPASNVVLLRTEGVVDTFYAPEKEWMEDKLVHALAQELRPYVRWTTCDDYCDMKRTYRAEVKVVADNY